LETSEGLGELVHPHVDLHRFAAYQAERYGGKYLYLCPLSLLHWASPIIRGGMLVGVMIAGPVLLYEPDALFVEELRHNLGVDDATIEHLYHRLKTLEVVSTARAGSLSQLLFLSSLSVSDNNVQHLFDEYGGFEHQCRIGEYLYLLKTMENDSHSDIHYPLEKEKELLRLTAEGERDGAKRILEELLAVIFFTTGIALDLVKSRVLELIVLLSRAAMEGGADVEQIFGLNYHYLNRIREIGTLEELSTWTMRIMERFTDIVFDLRSVRHTHAIIQAIRHVKGHYMKKMAQSEVASAVGLSPQYFSNLFKLEMHITFSDYVTKVRIEEAKRKLLETSTSVGDIAFECGFEDQSYFTKVFTKVVGIVPSRYRMTGGRIIK
jgi:YesN/AraC family two-component response regulator